MAQVRRDQPPRDFGPGPRTRTMGPELIPDQWSRSGFSRRRQAWRVSLHAALGVSKGNTVAPGPRWNPAQSTPPRLQLEIRGRQRPGRELAQSESLGSGSGWDVPRPGSLCRADPRRPRGPSPPAAGVSRYGQTGPVAASTLFFDPNLKPGDGSDRVESWRSRKLLGPGLGGMSPGQGHYVGLSSGSRAGSVPRRPVRPVAAG